MNREIEFRAFLIKQLKLVDIKRIDFEAQEIVYDEIDFEYEDVIREKTALFKDISWLQYTGLKDKNGVKIFEGDIVKTPTRKGRIQFIWGGWYFHTDKDGFVELHDVTDIIEVIGNIYENKELLNE